MHAAAVIVFVCGALRLGKSALITAIALQGILANLFVTKQTMLFGFQVTCAEVFVIGGMLGINLLQDYFGPKAAQQAIAANFWACAWFMILGQFHLAYRPLEMDVTHIHFSMILDNTPRIILASLIIMFLAQQFERALYGLISRAWLGASVAVCAVVSMSIAQIFDTVAFGYVALYDIVASVPDIIVMSLVIKLCIIFVMGPFCQLIPLIISRPHTSHDHHDSPIISDIHHEI